MPQLKFILKLIQQVSLDVWVMFQILKNYLELDRVLLFGILNLPQNFISNIFLDFGGKDQHFS